jgi:hypothetical protein
VGVVEGVGVGDGVGEGDGVEVVVIVAERSLSSFETKTSAELLLLLKDVSYAPLVVGKADD